MISQKKNKAENQSQIIKISQKENIIKNNSSSKKPLSQNKSNKKTKDKNKETKIKINKESLENKSQSKKIKKILKIKNPNKETSFSEETMKVILKEEPHTAAVPKKVTFSEKNTEENTVSKKEIIIHPRESYLKEKLNTMKSKFSENLLSNINKELFSQVNLIKKQLSDSNIQITEIPKNLNKYLPKLKQTKNNISFSSTPNLFLPILKDCNKDEYYTKKNYKNLRNLKEEQNILKKNLVKICENENLLENENKLNDLNNNFKVDYNIKIQQLKSLKMQKKELIDKINFLDIKINNIISNDKSSRLPKNQILKNFIKNFNRDKELSEIISRKYIIESNKRKIRINKEINSLKEKKIKEIKLKEKEADTQKEENLLKFKENQKSIELKQLKDKEQKTLKYKPYIREKPEKNINSYLFKVNQNKYLKNEEKLLLKENNKRKEIMKAINFQELKEFADNYDEQKSKNEEENKFKKLKLIKEWKERENLISEYKNQSSELLDNDKKEKLEDYYKNKEIQREDLIKLKKDYSLQVKEQYTPTINKQLYDKRINLIKELEKPISEKYKNDIKIRNLNKKKKKIIFKKIDPSKYSWKLKLEKDIFDKMNNSDMDMRYLIKRPKKINILQIYNKNKDITKNTNLKDNNKIEKKINKKLEINKWDKSFGNEKRNIYENMSEIKKEVDNMTKKALVGEKLLNKSGEIKNNVELGLNATSLLIDSIEAKLNILSELRK